MEYGAFTMEERRSYSWNPPSETPLLSDLDLRDSVWMKFLDWGGEYGAMANYPMYILYVRK